MAGGGVIDADAGQHRRAFYRAWGASPASATFLNAISLVLNCFVNHDSSGFSGDIEIANGVLNDKNLILQGNRATARIVTHTNLANATTDTTINFTPPRKGRCPTAPSRRVALSASPSFHATRWLRQ